MQRPLLGYIATFRVVALGPNCPFARVLSVVLVPYWARFMLYLVELLWAISLFVLGFRLLISMNLL